MNHLSYWYIIYIRHDCVDTIIICEYLKPFKMEIIDVGEVAVEKVIDFILSQNNLKKTNKRKFSAIFCVSSSNCCPKLL